MSVGKLITFFETFTKLPVRAEDVRDQIVELGIQDKIRFEPLDVSPDLLLGMFVKSREREVPYKEHKNIFTIFYNINVTPEEQNFICVKELMHVFDGGIFASGVFSGGNSKGVCNKSELDLLINHLFLKTFESSDLNLNGFHDELAVFMAAAIMFPHEIREDFLQVFYEGRMSVQNIAFELGIPENIVIQLVKVRWEETRKILLKL